MNDALKKIQKESGIKMGQYNNLKNHLYHQSKLFIKILETFISEVEKANLTNEDFFINFEDKLNELSIKDHSLPE